MQISRGGQGLHANHRTIIHLDLDCFYAQVEQKRLGIPAEVPCAVQQWEGLIAINYAARAQGITRHMRVHEAKARCPELVCVHVQTIGEAPGIQKQVANLLACQTCHPGGSFYNGSTAADASPGTSSAEEYPSVDVPAKVLGLCMFRHPPA